MLAVRLPVYQGHCVPALLQELQQAVQDAAAAKEEVQQQLEQLNTRIEELSAAKSSVKEQLKQAQAETADLRGQLEIETYQRGMIEGREKQQQTQMQELVERLRDKSEQMDAQQKRLEVSPAACHMPIPVCQAASKLRCYAMQGDMPLCMHTLDGGFAPLAEGDAADMASMCLLPSYLSLADRSMRLPHCRWLRSACWTWRTDPRSCTNATSALRHTST